MPGQEDFPAGGRVIKQIALSYFTDTEIVVAALIIFLLAFIAIVVWAVKRPKSEIEEMEQLPLEDERFATKEDSND